MSLLRIPTSTWYTVLEIDSQASASEVRKAYRSLCLRFHPDKNATEGAKRAFERVSEAYGVLSDEERRREYDLTLM